MSILEKHRDCLNAVDENKVNNFSLQFNDETSRSVSLIFEALDKIPSLMRTFQLPFVLFIMLHKVALTFESDLWMNYCNATSQIKAVK